MNCNTFTIRRVGVVRWVVVAMAAGLLSSSSPAASQFFDVNGDSPGLGITDGGSYSWDDANWAPDNSGTSATDVWGAGNFARFQGGASGNAYTVTVNNDESMAGLFETVSGVSLTINATGSGALDVTPGTNGFQGFIVQGSSSNVIINAPITGSGGVAPELAGSLYLYGNNSYSGPTAIGFTGAPLTYFNNDNSFGFSFIKNISTTSGNYATLIGTGGSPINLANPFVMTASNTGFNFANAPNTPVTIGFFGAQAAGPLLLRNSSPVSSPLTLQNGFSAQFVVMSGTSGSAFILNGSGSSAEVTLGVPGFTNVVLKLASSGALSGSLSVVMAGGTLDPSGMQQYMPNTTLEVTADSTLDFGAGASEVDFADSSGLNWTGTLDLVNWDPSIDAVNFGFSPTGLTPDQLASIEVNGMSLGTATLDSNGYLVAPVPEPSSVFLLIGASLMGLRRRRSR